MPSIFLFFVILFFNQSKGQLRGNAITCSDPDGTIVSIKEITGGTIAKPCIKCTCQDSLVNCAIDTCPHLRTCPLADEPSNVTTSSCCPKCRTCTYLGTQRSNNDRWKSVQDPCYSMTCKAGIVTSSRMQCGNHCRDGLQVPGYCCQLCAKYNETATRDPCVHCDSVMGIWYHCYRLACPVLDCPMKFTHRPKGKCCPECQHPSPHSYRTSPIENPRLQGFCTFRLRRYDLNEIFHVDPCTRCHCQSGGVTCRRFTCPIRKCHSSATLIYRKNVCCPFCQYTVSKPDDHIAYDVNMTGTIGEFKAETDEIGKPPGLSLFSGKITTCTHKLPNGTIQVKKHQSFWKASECLNCQCRSGKIKCELENCYPKEPFVCPKGSKKVKLIGKCCAFCEQYESTCTVFGDPHYETFDGLDYSFHGNRSYVLAQECGFVDDIDSDEQPDFAVIAHNLHNEKDGTHTGRISVVLKVDNTQKSTILQLSKKKVFIENDRHITLPKNTSLYSVEENQSGHLQLIIPMHGLKLAFDGRGFAEVTLSTIHKGKVCGLCGNYNDDPKDDLWPKYADSVTENVDQFAASWRWKAARTNHRCKTASLTTEKAEDLSQCRTLLDNKFFAFCRKQIHVHGYFRQCTRDVCECQRPTNSTSKPCFCDSIEAFATQCANRFVWGQWTQILQNLRQFPVHPECDKIKKPKYL